MLTRLLRRHLRPYTGLIAVVLVLQLVATIASLLLPTLNADLIDDGSFVEYGRFITAAQEQQRHAADGFGRCVAGVG